MYPIPEEVRAKAIFWYQFPNGNAITGCTRRDSSACATISHLFWMNKLGEITRREEVSLAMESYEMTRNISEVALQAVVAPLPLVAFAQLGEEGMVKYIGTGVAVVTDGLFVVLCYRRQRKFGARWTGMWMVFVLLFGLPGYLGYLAHRKWPTRLPCPSCRRAVPRDRLACLACGQDFPAPARKGIEVFV